MMSLRAHSCLLYLPTFYYALTCVFKYFEPLVKFLRLIVKCLFWRSRCLLCRVATPSGSCWRLPRRQCQRKTGGGPRWSWRPQRVCACCLKTRPTRFWRRWGTVLLCPQTVWHKHHPSRQGAGWETTKCLQVSLKKKAASLPIWWLSCCKKTAVVGLCGVTIFVI